MRFNTPVFVGVPDADVVALVKLMVPEIFYRLMDLGSRRKLSSSHTDVTNLLDSFYRFFETTLNERLVEIDALVRCLEQQSLGMLKITLILKITKEQKLLVRFSLLSGILEFAKNLNFCYIPAKIAVEADLVKCLDYVLEARAKSPSLYEAKTAPYFEALPPTSARNRPGAPFGDPTFYEAWKVTLKPNSFAIDLFSNLVYFALHGQGLFYCETALFRYLYAEKHEANYTRSKLYTPMAFSAHLNEIEAVREIISRVLNIPPNDYVLSSFVFHTELCQQFSKAPVKASQATPPNLDHVVCIRSKQPYGAYEDIVWV